ncbi:MAG: hypothetical protein BWY06_00597 [Candidatus Latescibacteria bacterium ADurb.Bin168]|nr:MAG: hypothetical protein BWY06_00597 [Candidatus Latescibacteria bacterium ADurb.Bin168]
MSRTSLLSYGRSIRICPSTHVIHRSRQASANSPCRVRVPSSPVSRRNVENTSPVSRGGMASTSIHACRSVVEKSAQASSAALRAARASEVRRNLSDHALARRRTAIAPEIVSARPVICLPVSRRPSASKASPAISTPGGVLCLTAQRLNASSTKTMSFAARPHTFLQSNAAISEAAGFAFPANRLLLPACGPSSSAAQRTGKNTRS